MLDSKPKQIYEANSLLTLRYYKEIFTFTLRKSISLPALILLIRLGKKDQSNILELLPWKDFTPKLKLIV